MNQNNAGLNLNKRINTGKKRHTRNANSHGKLGAFNRSNSFVQVNHAANMLNQQLSKIEQENLKMIDRLANVTPSIKPYQKQQRDFKEHKKRVKTIQRLQKVQHTIVLKTDVLNKTIHGFYPNPPQDAALLEASSKSFKRLPGLPLTFPPSAIGLSHA